MNDSPFIPQASSFKPQAFARASSLRRVPSRLKPQASSLAFTLVEMLIAMALPLILFYAIAYFYAIVGDPVKAGRGMIEMNHHLRAVVQRLKADLDLVTIPAVPW